jgi:hypothetical protein
MKWLKFFAVVLAFILTMVGIDRLYAPIRTWADTMLGAYRQNKDSIDVVIIGHSHTGAIRQRVIGDLNAINFSYAGMELKDRLDFLREILKEKGRIKYVIMALDYDQVGRKTSDPMVHNMLLPYIVNNETGWDGKLKRLSPNNFLRHNRDLRVLYDYYVSKQYNKNDTNFIPVNFTEKTDMSACTKRALELAKISYSDSRVEENFRLLAEIRDLLAQRGITLVLLNTPKSECFNKIYFENLDTSQLPRIRKFIEENNLVYADFGRSTAFSEDEFRDFDHLNEKGSQVLCDSLWNILRAHNSQLAKK